MESDDIVMNIDSVYELVKQTPQLLMKIKTLVIDEENKLHSSLYMGSAITTASQIAPHIRRLGETGSGKKSLINVLLGVDLPPAEESTRGVTSVVTEMVYDPEIVCYMCCWWRGWMWC